MVRTVTVEATVDGSGGVVATRRAQSPKQDGRWWVMFWTGPDTKHPGCPRWSTDPAVAARFDSVEELEVALATLHEPHVVGVSQPPLW